MKSKFSLFSSMEWLDQLIEQNKKSPGRNICSDYYYKTLLSIKKAQENGTITDELYSRFNHWFGIISPEEGYYNSNIHYDLWDGKESIESIENRIIHFLEKSDKTVLKNAEWFKWNFLIDLRCFMRKRYDIKDKADDDDEFFFNKYGNKIAKELFNEYKMLTGKK